MPLAVDDRLFGSVTAKEIESTAKAAGVTIDRKKMQLAEPLKALGSFEIPVKLMPGANRSVGVQKVRITMPISSASTTASITA